MVLGSRVWVPGCKMYFSLWGAVWPHRSGPTRVRLGGEPEAVRGEDPSHSHVVLEGQQQDPSPHPQALALLSWAVPRHQRLQHRDMVAFMGHCPQRG